MEPHGLGMTTGPGRRSRDQEGVRPAADQELRAAQRSAQRGPTFCLTILGPQRSWGRQRISCSLPTGRWGVVRTATAGANAGLRPLFAGLGVPVGLLSRWGWEPINQERQWYLTSDQDASISGQALRPCPPSTPVQRQGHSWDRRPHSHSLAASTGPYDGKQ